MKWPWSKREARESDGTYEGQILSAFENAATTPATAGATAAVEAAASMAGRCLASATVTGAPSDCVGPAELMSMGRDLLRRGQSVWRIVVAPDGMVRLALVGHWDHYGGPDPASWTMRLSEYGPSGTETRTVPWAGVVDVKYQADRVRPWWGLSPLAAASEAGRLSAAVTKALADEAGGPVGSLIETPKDGEDPTVASIKTALPGLRGRAALVESGDFDVPGGGRGMKTWQVTRLGSDPPAGAVTLAHQAFVEALAACGVPPALFGERSDGTAQRESFRRYQHSTLAPLAKLIAAELTVKLDSPVEIDLTAIHAADVMSKARAWRSLTGPEATMDPMMAARIVGFEGGDE